MSVWPKAQQQWSPTPFSRSIFRSIAHPANCMSVQTCCFIVALLISVCNHPASISAFVLLPAIFICAFSEYLQCGRVDFVPFGIVWMHYSGVGRWNWTLSFWRSNWISWKCRVTFLKSILQILPYQLGNMIPETTQESPDAGSLI